MSVVDYYQILQLPRDADEVQIKKSYKALALKWHPDKNIENEKLCTKMFRRIHKAYSVLSDPMKRRLYDDETRNREDKRNEYRTYKRTHNHYHKNHRKFNYDKKPFKHENKTYLHNKFNTTWFDALHNKNTGQPLGFQKVPKSFKAENNERRRASSRQKPKGLFFFDEGFSTSSDSDVDD